MKRKMMLIILMFLMMFMIPANVSDQSIYESDSVLDINTTVIEFDITNAIVINILISGLVVVAIVFIFKKCNGKSDTKVLILCAYCGNKHEQGLDICPTCGT